MPAFISRREYFDVVGSTNDVVRDWLAAGTPEVCLAVAGEQSAGRGREGRTWIAPPGAALLLSLGFRPTWLAPELAWRLAATASLAMAEAAESVAGLADGAVRLKWPNDLVLEVEPQAGEGGGRGWRKLGGVLGETDGLGTARPRVVIGVGINADWAEADFPPALAADMTSLRAAGGERVDPAALLEAFLARLEARVSPLRARAFDSGAWAARQATTGRTIRLELPGGAAEVVRALDVDPLTGALIVQDDPGEPERQVLSAEVHHLRLGPTAARV